MADNAAHGTAEPQDILQPLLIAESVSQAAKKSRDSSEAASKAAAAKSAKFTKHRKAARRSHTKGSLPGNFKAVTYALKQQPMQAAFSGAPFLSDFTGDVTSVAASAQTAHAPMASKAAAASSSQLAQQRQEHYNEYSQDVHGMVHDSWAAASAARSELVAAARAEILGAVDVHLAAAGSALQEELQHATHSASESAQQVLSQAMQHIVHATHEDCSAASLQVAQGARAAAKALMKRMAQLGQDVIAATVHTVTGQVEHEVAEQVFELQQELQEELQAELLRVEATALDDAQHQVEQVMSEHRSQLNDASAELRARLRSERADRIRNARQAAQAAADTALESAKQEAQAAADRDAEAAVQEVQRTARQHADAALRKQAAELTRAHTQQVAQAEQTAASDMRQALDSARREAEEHLKSALGALRAEHEETRQRALADAAEQLETQRRAAVSRQQETAAATLKTELSRSQLGAEQQLQRHLASTRAELDAEQERQLFQLRTEQKHERILAVQRLQADKAAVHVAALQQAAELGQQALAEALEQAESAAVRNATEALCSQQAQWRSAADAAATDLQCLTGPLGNSISPGGSGDAVELLDRLKRALGDSPQGDAEHILAAVCKLVSSLKADVARLTERCASLARQVLQQKHKQKQVPHPSSAGTMHVQADVGRSDAQLDHHQPRGRVVQPMGGGALEGRTAAEWRETAQQLFAVNQSLLNSSAVSAPQAHPGSSAPHAPHSSAGGFHSTHTHPPSSHLRVPPAPDSVATLEEVSAPRPPPRLGTSSAAHRVPSTQQQHSHPGIGVPHPHPNPGHAPQRTRTYSFDSQALHPPMDDSVAFQGIDTPVRHAHVSASMPVEAAPYFAQLRRRQEQPSYTAPNQAPSSKSNPNQPPTVARLHHADAQRFHAFKTSLRGLAASAAAPRKYPGPAADSTAPQSQHPQGSSDYYAAQHRSGQHASTGAPAFVSATSAGHDKTQTSLPRARRRKATAAVVPTRSRRSKRGQPWGTSTAGSKSVASAMASPASSRRSTKLRAWKA